MVNIPERLTRDLSDCYRLDRELGAGGAATVRVSPVFAPIRREVLFESDLIGDLLQANFDVTPDGKHFLMLAPTGDVAQVVVALNWTATLRGGGSARSATR